MSFKTKDTLAAEKNLGQFVQEIQNNQTQKGEESTLNISPTMQHTLKDSIFVVLSALENLRHHLDASEQRMEHKANRMEQRMEHKAKRMEHEVKRMEHAAKSGRRRGITTNTTQLDNNSYMINLEQL